MSLCQEEFRNKVRDVTCSHSGLAKARFRLKYLWRCDLGQEMLI